MSFEIIDNTFQVIVLAAMALLAFLLVFRPPAFRFCQAAPA